MDEEQKFRELFPSYCRGERCLSPYFDLFQAGIRTQEEENKYLKEALECAEHNCKVKQEYNDNQFNMMKLKDEGIVKPLKDSILQNERLSSQEQQELCAWIECAMDFGENLDECAKELEEVSKANEWHFVKDGDFPSPNVRVDVWVKLSKNYETKYIAYWRPTIKKWQIYNLIEASRQVKDEDFLDENEVIAWKEIVLPELKESV